MTSVGRSSGAFEPVPRLSITTLVGHAGLFVRHFAHRDAEDQVLVLHGAFDIGQHRQGVRIPFRQPVAALDGRALVHLQARAIDDAVGGAFLALIVGDHDLHVAAHRDQLTVGILDDVAVHDLDLAVIRRLDLRLARHLRRAADMEGAHGELGARLADRLGGDHADRLADIDRGSARQIAAIALAANAFAAVRRSAPNARAPSGHGRLRSSRPGPR